MNIVLTIADDQRGTAVGCAGREPVLTPALDELAARGARFSQAQHMGSCHGAVCAPSRAMLMTGVPYFQLDISLLGANYPPKDRTIAVPPTLGQKLRGAGYHTFATGKWHNGVQTFHPSFDSGANLFLGGMADHWFTPVHDFDPSGAYPAGKARIADGFSTEVFAQSVIDFIRSRKGNKQPFFCYCAFTAPHDPRTPPDAWRKLYDPLEMPLPPNFNTGDSSSHDEALMAEAHQAKGRDELLLGTPRNANAVRRSLAEYYGMISHMDDWIGRIHRAVEEIDESKNTLVIHTADHGLGVGQHGLLGKQNLYQHSLNVPLIMAGPGVPHGVISDALCYQHDLHPTLMEMTGIGTTPLPFRSLLPTLRDNSKGRSHIGAAFEDTQRSVRDSRYKLIEYNVRGEKLSRLFHLENDPWEMYDLSGNESCAPILTALRRKLGEWREHVGDPADGGKRNYPG